MIRMIVQTQILILYLFNIITGISADNCLLRSPLDPTNCYQCQLGYYSQQPQTLDQSFNVTACKLATNTSQQIIFYVSSSKCSSKCDGTNTKPFPNLLLALASIPYPSFSPFAIPNIVINIQDQSTYILNSHVTTGSSSAGYYNRRMPINLVIQPDPNLFIVSPTIYVKTEKFSIFISSSLTINGFIISGLGLNENPYSDTNSILCTKQLQAQMYNSSTTAKGSMNCGIKYSQVVKSTQEESVGLFTLEPMFDLGPTLIIPNFMINQCTFQDFYSFDIQRFVSLIKIGIQLPSNVMILNSFFYNIFFEQGLIGSLQYQNRLLNQIYSNTSLMNAYSTFKSSQSTNIQFQIVVITGYNSLRIVHQSGFDTITGAIVSIADQPLNLQLTETIFNSSNITDPYYYPVPVDEGASIAFGLNGDGNDYGHYQIILYTSIVVVNDNNSIPLMSYLNINQLTFDQVSYNAGIVFFATTSPSYFLNISNTVHNQANLNGLVCTNSFLRQVVIHSNVDFFVSNNFISNITFNLIYLAKVFYNFNYQQQYSYQSSVIQNLNQFYIGDEIDELNCIIYHDNLTISTPKYPIFILIKDCIFQNMFDTVIFEGRQQQPQETRIINIQIKNHRILNLIWGLFGTFFQQLLIVDTVSLIDSYVWELFTVKQVPPIAKYSNIYLTRTWVNNIVSFRGSKLTIYNWSQTIDNFTSVFSDADCQTNQYWLSALVKDNARRQDLTQFTSLGTFTIQNSNIQLCGSRTSITSVFNFQSPWQTIVQSTSIRSYGPLVLFGFDSTFVAPFVQYFSLLNCIIYRNSIIINPPQSQWQLSDYADQQKTDYFVDFGTSVVNIQNSSFYDTGLRFAVIRLTNSLGGVISNSSFFNFGFYILSPQNLLTFSNVKMQSSNRNMSSTYFLFVQKSTVPIWVNNRQDGSGSLYSDVIVKNCSFLGNLTNGIFQLTNVKLYVENSIIAAKDLYLTQLQQSNQSIPNNLVNVASLIILKSNGWVYLNNTKMHNCSSSTSNSIQCVEAFKTAVVEAYNSRFRNSNSSFGSFIYGFKVYISIYNCIFYNGQANKGGSIYIINSTLNIQGGSFNQSSSIYTGGHIYADSSTISINSTIFSYGYSKDSGSSIYCYNVYSLSLLNTSFSNMKVQVQAVLFSQSQKYPTNVNMQNVVFENCSSFIKTVSLFIGFATLNMQNVSFNNQQLSNFNNQIQKTVVPLISLINVNLIINSVNFQNCLTNTVVLMQQSQGSITKLYLASTFFDQNVFQIEESTVQFNQFNISFQRDVDFITQLQNKNEYFLQQSFKKTLFVISDGSNVIIQNSTILQLVIVSMIQGYEANSVIKEIISGIQSSNSRISIINNSFIDQYLQTNSQFLDIKQYNKGRILFTILNSQVLNQATSLDVQGGYINIVNTTFPNFAINCPIVSIVNSEFFIDSIYNQRQDLLTKSIIDSYCYGPYSNLCNFIDYVFTFTTQPNINGQYTIQNSKFKSYGMTLNITSLGNMSPNMKLTNLSLQSRQGVSNSTPMYVQNSIVQINQISITSYSQPLTITQFSNVQITNAQIMSGLNGGINIFQSNLTLRQSQFDSNSAISGGALHSSSCQQNDLTQIIIQNCSFTNNDASDSGGAIRNENCRLAIDNSTVFKNNTATYGSNYLGYPQFIMLNQIISLSDQQLTNLAAIAMNISTFSLNQSQIQNQTLYVVGGQKASFIINIIDNFFQIYPLGTYFSNQIQQQVITSANSDVVVELKTQDQIIKITLISYSFELVSNAIIINEFYAFAKQNYVGSSGQNLIEVLIDGNVLGSFNLIILPCPQGTISSIDRCFLCPMNTYSLNPLDVKCTNCGKYQTCNGRNYLFADEGYFISLNTSSPQTCPTMHACSQLVISSSTLDSIYMISYFKSTLNNLTYNLFVPFLSNNDMMLLNTTQNQFCAEGYQGPFCSTCKAGYGKTSDGFCYSCQTSQTIYIKFVVSFLIVLAINYKYSVEPLEQEDLDRPILSQVILKQITDFTQFVNIVVSMISNVSPSMLPALTLLTNQISLFPTDFSSGFDCFFLQNVQDPLQKFKYQLVVNSLIPWGFSLILVFVILVIDKIKKYLKYDSIPQYVTLFDILIVTIVANLYNFYFFLAQLCLNIFSCIDLNDQNSASGQVSVLAVLTQLKCWESDHLQLVLTYAIPTMILYVIGIPCLFAYFISKYYKEDDIKDGNGQLFILRSVSEKESFINREEDQEIPIDFVIDNTIQTNHKQSQFKKSSVKDISIIQKQDASAVNIGMQDSEHHHKDNQSQKRLEEEQEEIVIVRYSGFLTDNLKPQYKYWGIYVQFKKLLIITIMILTQSLDVATASIVVLIVFIIFMMISYRHQPYQYLQLNYYESATDLLLTFIIHLSLLIVQSKTQAVQVFSVILIIFFKFGFYYYGLKIIVHEYLEYFRKLAEQISKKKTKKEETKQQKDRSK